MNTEKNKIIAEFMGYEKIVFPENSRWLGQYKNQFTKRIYELKELDFDSDWNLLMEVVEKIFKTAEDEKIEDEADCTELLPVIKEAFYAPQKENVYNCCLDFIIWYNEQNSTK